MTENDNSQKVLNIMVVGAKEGKGSAHIDKFMPSLKKKSNYKITYVGWDRSKKLPKLYEEDKVAYKMIFRGWGYGGKMLMFALPVWCIRLFFFLLFQKPDIVIAIDLDCAFSAALSKVFTRIPVLYIILDTYALRPTIPPFLRSSIQFVDNWVMKKSDNIIVPDETRILPEYKQKEKFTVIYNCCIDIANTISPERKSREGKPFTVLATGRLMSNRGVGLLLSAAESIPDMHMIMAGDIQEASISRRIDANKNVKFLGRVSLEESLRLCFDSDVVFTFYDPCSEINRRAASNKWSDSMMASRPILVNSELVKADWIKKSNIGYCCPYNDVNALIKCLEFIMNNPEDAREKGENGRKLFLEGYNWEKMEERLYLVLDNCTKNKIGYL